MIGAGVEGESCWEGLKHRASLPAQFKVQKKN